MFSSNRGTSYDLYVAARPDRASAFCSPSLVAELSALGVDASPTLPADELEIFFISNRSGGLGAYDVWRSERASTTSAWTVPVNVPSVSSPQDEWGLSLSSDGRRLYYSYSSSVIGGNADIWVATRDCL